MTPNNVNSEVAKYPSPRKLCIGVLGGDAEVELLPDDLWLFSGYFWHILANNSYFLAIVWLILDNPG